MIRTKAGFAIVALLLAACAPVRFDAVSPGEWGSVSPACDFRNGSVLVLEAQSVPTAALIPCIAQLPPGWSVRDVTAEQGLTRFRLDSDRHGDKFLEVSLADACAPLGVSHPYITGGGITQRSIEATAVADRYEGAWYHQFDGGCVVYSFAAQGTETALVAVEAEGALSFVTRATVDRFVRGAVGIPLDPALMPTEPGPLGPL